MSAKRPAINRDLLEGLERQLSDAMERVSDDDPLAELARLIEEDPFAEDIASPRAESPRGRPVDVARQAPQAFHDEPPTGYRPEVEANYTPEPPRSGVTPDPGIRGSTDPLADLLTADAIAEELRRTSAPEPTPVAAPEPDFDFTEQLSRRIAPEPEPAPDLAATNDIFLDPGRLARDVEAAIGMPPDPVADELRFDTSHRDDTRGLFGDDGSPETPELDDPFAAPEPERGAFGWDADEPTTARRGAIWDDPVFDDAATDPRFDDRDPFAEPADNGYADRDARPVSDQMPGDNRMRGLVIVIAVISFVIVGAVVAFAYRSFFGGADGTPPTVAADTTPDKVEPDQPASAEQPEAGKLVYDRLNGDEGTAAEIVTDGNDQGADTTGRVVRIIEPAAPPAEGEGVASANGDEPRRVRTVVVRPDGTVVAGGGEASSSQSATVPEPPTTAVTTQETASVTETASVPEPPASDSTIVETTTIEAPETAAEPPTSPDVETVAVATPRPAPAAPAAAQPATTQAETTAAVPAGAFLVQVAATREEGQARSTANSVQQRFAGIIGGYQPTVQRADLGSRGIFYRVAVGPMTSQQEAAQVCDRLKSAGLDCFVRRN